MHLAPSQGATGSVDDGGPPKGALENQNRSRFPPKGGLAYWNDMENAVFVLLSGDNPLLHWSVLYCRKLRFIVIRKRESVVFLVITVGQPLGL